MISLNEAPGLPRLVLASGSPRRRELLSAAGLQFETISPEVDEIEAGELPPRDLVLTNARLKAEAVVQSEENSLVLGADTVVALAGTVFGKPKDLSEAFANLQKFRGRVQEVMTGVVLTDGSRSVEFVETSYLKFRNYSDEVIEDYLSKVSVLDKAGGYAIQDHGKMLVEKLEGDFDNVVGLPVGLVLDQLERMNFEVQRASE